MAAALLQGICDSVAAIFQKVSAPGNAETGLLWFPEETFLFVHLRQFPRVILSEAKNPSLIVPDTS